MYHPLFHLDKNPFYRIDLSLRSRIQKNKGHNFYPSYLNLFYRKILNKDDIKAEEEERKLPISYFQTAHRLFSIINLLTMTNV